MGLFSFLRKKQSLSIEEIFSEKNIQLISKRLNSVKKSLSSRLEEIDEMHDRYLFDFKAGYRHTGWDDEMMMPAFDNRADDEKNGVKNIKIVIKPIDVLVELETIPTPFSVELIDEKINILNEKANLINQKYAKREVEALIERMHNRKRYQEKASFFNQFQNTNDEKIAVLLRKYELVMKSADLFIPEFPDDAVRIMVEYKNHVMAICEKEPVFYVIAEPSDFKEKEGKRDPILLVQSPFGFYWQILGAWDKEMLYLPEL